MWMDLSDTIFKEDQPRTLVAKISKIWSCDFREDVKNIYSYT